MNKIVVVHPVEYVFTEFRNLETLQFFFLTDPKKMYQKVPVHRERIKQGHLPEESPRDLNAVKLSTGEGVYITADVCVHPMNASIELSPQVVESPECEPLEGKTKT